MTALPGACQCSSTFAAERHIPDTGQRPAGWWALRWSSVPYSPLSMAALSPVFTVSLSSAMDSSER